MEKLTAPNNAVTTVCRMIPLSTPEPTQELITLLTAASRAALGYHNLTPIGAPAVAIREVDSWVIETWLGCGNKRDQLQKQVLLMAFPCVPTGSEN
jgi:hypothetical protein